MYYLVFTLLKKKLIFIDNLFMQKSLVAFPVLCIKSFRFTELYFIVYKYYMYHLVLTLIKKNTHFYWQSLHAKVSGKVFCFMHHNRLDLQN